MAETRDSFVTHMEQAISEARAAFSQGEVPVGAVAVVNGEVIAAARNEKERNNDATAHAEILLIRRVGEALGSWRLENVKIFVTLEPCPMCAEALNQARVSEVIYGCDDTQYGAYSRKIITPNMPVIAGICEDECKTILKEFFKSKR